MSTKPKTSQKWILIVGGTALTLVVAGLLYQVLQPQPTQAGRSKNTASSKEKSPQNTNRKKPMARVNGTLNSYDMLAQECIARHGKKVLEGLINRTMVEQEFLARADSPTRQDIDKYIRETAKKFNLDSEQWLQMMQNQEEEMTPDQYRRDIIWPMLALRRLAGSSVEISKKELAQAYQRNYGERVRVRVIVLDRMRQAEEVWEQANQKPDDFERLAMKHSVDSSSRALGGSVPPIRRYAGSKTIENAAFKLKPGEISAAIQIPESKQWVILKCEGRTQPIEVEFKDVKAMLEDELREEKVRSLAHRTFENLQARARVDNYLTGVTTGSNKKATGRRDTRVKQTSGTRPTSRRKQTKPRSKKR